MKPSRPHPSWQHRLPANPRSPNRPLLVTSIVALAVWMVVLVLIALRFV